MKIDQIIYLLKRYTISNNTEDGEIGEQDAGTDTGASAGGAYPTVTK